MSTTRRLSITKEQGELIALALVALIDELEQLTKKYPEAYWKFQLERAESLKHSLNTYNWEK